MLLFPPPILKQTDWLDMPVAVAFSWFYIGAVRVKGLLLMIYLNNNQNMAYILLDINGIQEVWHLFYRLMLSNT